MKFFKKILQLVLYIVCAIILGKIFVYFPGRFHQIIDAISSRNMVPPLILIFYLLFLATCSLIIIFGVKDRKIQPVMFSCAAYAALVTSLLYMGVFHFVYVPDFEPFELVYVVNDAAIYGAIMGLLCVVVKQEGIGGIVQWKLNSD